MIIGITGGSGCGKTTALEVIRELGGVVLDCDELYHELLKTDKALLWAIDGRFPGTVVEGVLDRKKLGAIVFSDENALRDLNQITHGAVKAEVIRRLSPPPALAAIDAFALFGGGLAELCDVTVAVTAPLEVRVKRLMARDGITEDYARARIAAQRDESGLCSHLLENHGTICEFKSECLAFFRHLTIIDSKR